MKIAIINPSYRTNEPVAIQCLLGNKNDQDENMSFEQYDLILCGSMLLKHDYDIKIFNFENTMNIEIQNKMNDFHPEVIIFPNNNFQISHNFNKFCEFLTYIKKICPYSKIVIIGRDSSYLWPVLIKRFNVDYIVLNGDYSVLIQLLNCLQNEKSFVNIKGLAYKFGSLVGVNKKEKDDFNWDDIPSIDYSILDIPRSKYFIYELATGCPFRCRFCYTERKIVIKKDINRVRIELLEMHKKGINNILIIDENLTISRKYLKDFVVMLSLEKLSFNFKVYSRVDTIDEEKISLLKQIGVNEIRFGFESGDADMLIRMGKKHTVSQMNQAVDLASKYGIQVMGLFIIGYPGENNDTIKNTYDFIKKNRLENWCGHIAMAFPGTALYQELLEEKIFSDEMWYYENPLISLLPKNCEYKFNIGDLKL